MISTRIRPRYWKLTAVFLGVVLIAAILIATRKSDSMDVLAARASYRDLNQQVTTNGTVFPVNEFQARAFWPGIVDKVNVELGDKVKPGQLLVSMKDPFAVSRMTAARAALDGWQLSEENIRNGGTKQDQIDLHGKLEQAQLTQADATKSLNALRQLQQKGAASEAEVNAAAQKVQSANEVLQNLREKSSNPYSAAELKNATSHLADAQANVDSAKVQFNNANIASPIVGTVYSIKVVAYDWVPVGADLIRVADLNQVEIRAYFDEPEIGKLAAGQPVKITWDGKPDRAWHGHIKQAPIAATALGPRSVGECIIAVDDAKEDLLPNTNVIVTATIQQHNHALTIPRAALHTDGPKNFVFCVVDGRVKKTDVDTGIVNLDRAEITNGLTENSVVVLNPLDNSRELRDGLPISSVQPAPSE
ncbi:MAG TPA: efflux RND transporter periplasmic adaptor subunit [Acidobacteriaceae bacterium]|jgi:HlyD family secretion protein